ncbi:hypothetical protein FE257_005404 [Aspergillus nanangensis]|uniref:Uncharacterized protein n=1 Tax=Aspergillus nanangensis TaxID=2582783 RepID=A0AAD4GWT3_ASPNN|nr:hypothetical protein FE257_005404 [Aspergillus nanangensis]
MYYALTPRLREIYRVKYVDLGSIKKAQGIDVRPHLTMRRTLKFVEVLIFNGYCDDHREWNRCFLHTVKDIVLRLLTEWRDLQKDWMKARNFFAFKVLQLQKDNTESLFPRLRRLSVRGVGFQYAHTEMAYTFQLHKLHALSLDSAHILGTIAEIAENKMIPIISLTIKTDEQFSRLEQQFFALSMPHLKDVFIRIVAPDQTSLTPHLRWIFTPGREIRRFVYHRHLYVAGDTASVWEPTVAPMVWDTGVVTLLGNANLQCVGLCDHLPSLRFHLAKTPPTTWEILHIRYLPTVHEEYHPHNPTFDLTYDFDVSFNLPPTSILNLAPYRLGFTTEEMTEFLAFANWAFGPNGLPKLELLVFGEVDTVHWVQALKRSIFLTRNMDVASRMKYPYRQTFPLGAEPSEHDRQATPSEHTAADAYQQANSAVMSPHDGAANAFSGLLCSHTIPGGLLTVMGDERAGPAVARFIIQTGLLQQFRAVDTEAVGVTKDWVHWDPKDEAAGDQEGENEVEVDGEARWAPGSDEEDSWSSGGSEH